MKTFTLPDIGDFKNVEIIEICAKTNEDIEKNQTIIILESDKATIDVPADEAGTVQNWHVSVGQRVSKGDKIFDYAAKTSMPEIEKPAEVISQTTTKQAAEKSSENNIALNKNININNNNNYDYDLIVIGAGPGGYSAAFRAADLGLKVAIIEKHENLGGVCLNVGCIPSKALLHYAQILDNLSHANHAGIKLAVQGLDLNAVRDDKNKTIQKLTQGLKAMAKARKVDAYQGLAHFIDQHNLEIVNSKNDSKKLSFKNVIIATGSRPIDLPFLPKDPRIINSTGALELPFIPKTMLIIGGGIIGLEMATVYKSLGVAEHATSNQMIEIDVVEMQSRLMAGADMDLVKVWQKRNQGKNSALFRDILLNTKTIAANATEQGIEIHFENINSQEKTQKTYDLVLVAVGRVPNSQGLNLEQIGIQANARGFIDVDKQQRIVSTSTNNIFAIGDVIGQPMLAHKAVHEGHVAAEVVSGAKAYFDTKIIPSVAYTHPEVAWVGETEETCRSQNIAFKKAVFPWQASGRAIANHTEDGFTKLLFDETTGRIIGGGIVGDHAGDLIGEVALAIEMGADAVDIGKTIHPHPTLCETIGMAAEVAKGSCTDIMPTNPKS